MKQILIKTKFIQLDQFLKYIGAINTGGMAKIFLENNTVLVNEKSEKSKRKKLYIGDIVQVNEQKYTIFSTNIES